MAMPPTTADEPDALAAELAREFSALVRADVEIVLAERQPALRDLGITVAVGVAAAVGGLLVLAFSSWTALLGLHHFMRAWIAAFVVASGWAIVVVVLLWIEYKRYRRWPKSGLSRAEVMAAALEERAQAETELRSTAGRLGSAVRAEIIRREREAILSVERRVVNAAEHEVESVIKQLFRVLTAPRRAGVDFLEWLVDGSQTKETRR